MGGVGEMEVAAGLGLCYKLTIPVWPGRGRRRRGLDLNFMQSG